MFTKVFFHQNSQIAALLLILRGIYGCLPMEKGCSDMITIKSLFAIWKLREIVKWNSFGYNGTGWKTLAGYGWWWN